MAPAPPNHVPGQACDCCMLRRIDSVEVHNAMLEPVHVAVAYENRHGKEREEQMIAPGCSYHFQKKIIEKGTSRVIAPVQTVSVMHSNGSETLEPVVNSFVVRKLDVHIQLDGRLEQGTEHW